MEESLWSQLPDFLTAISAFLRAVAAGIPAFLPLVIAAIVAWIGFQQFRLSREKFKLDLFEKRFAVYKAAQKFLSITLRDAKVELADLFEYQGNTQDAVFLFDQETADYLMMLYHKALELQTTDSLLTDRLPKGEERTRLALKNRELLKELHDELPKLKDIFSPYLKFEVWK